MRSFLRAMLTCLVTVAGLLGLSSAGHAQGTLPLALVQQFDANGAELAGCLVYFYQAGTVATPQNSYQDYGLSILNPNPITCDQTGRVPMFWLANGLIHVRLTDSSGNVYLDTTMQVLGPSSGSGGGGSTVDPTTIFATGDIKFRPTSEVLTGWVKMNGQTIGSATSGATGYANAATQNLFIYLWNNCTNAHCPVPGGRGASGLADFSANKQITVPDWRDRVPTGLDDMGNTPAGGILPSNVTSGGGDSVTTPAASGGAANATIAQANLPNVTFTGTAAAQSITTSIGSGNVPGGSASVAVLPPAGNTTTTLMDTAAPSVATVSSGGSGTALGVISPFVLGSWYLKL